MGGDSLALTTPQIRLNCLSIASRNVTVEDRNAVVMRRLSCDPKGFWKSWQEDLLQLQRDWRVDAKELTLSARVKGHAGTRDVRALIDTGAKSPLVIRKGVFPHDRLWPPSFPWSS